jgi:hypothetical protein
LIGLIAPILSLLYVERLDVLGVDVEKVASNNYNRIPASERGSPLPYQVLSKHLDLDDGKTSNCDSSTAPETRPAAHSLLLLELSHRSNLGEH